LRGARGRKRTLSPRSVGGGLADLQPRPFRAPCARPAATVVARGMPSCGGPGYAQLVELLVDPGPFGGLALQGTSPGLRRWLQATAAHSAAVAGGAVLAAIRRLRPTSELDAYKWFLPDKSVVAWHCVADHRRVLTRRSV